MSGGFEGWERADNLWQHSCFELFGRVVGEPGYLEVNLATTAQWAAYSFSDRREGMRLAEDVTLIQAHWRIRERNAEMNAILQIPADYERADWSLGASAVIEEADGTKSYWALRHPPGKPDFHHPDCFALELPAPGNP